ncbi:8-oxo-dGTP diphosphatase MutT [Sandarakinorhabdus sp.]|uniref:8-oxo-dGTP diphosphatase MutT n=1 Tax=Sandarakinorhabdus sp. TaxID=1916663 RepID=UPI00286DF541|nr:8-oxo-dGTP diphosphatase MutT [Sandarakinorhabdus sp.]
MRLVTVVAAALVGGDGRVLLAQRPPGKSLAGLWEFPGGKLEPGETPEAALVRELAEELGITAPALRPFSFVSHDMGDFHLLMLLYLCEDWQGTPQGLDGQALRWAFPQDMAALPMPPADVPLVSALVAALPITAFC